MASLPFRFKKFSVEQEGAAHPVGTDGVLLGAWADVEGCKTMLDIGTGTGVVALMLAQRSPDAHITAVEIHAVSADLADRNFANSPWATRLGIEKCSILDFVQNVDRQYDLIVSNPPFFSETTVSPNATRRLSRHSASLPLSDLLVASQKLLGPEGRLCVILPVPEGKRMCELAVSNGLYCTEEVAVHARPEKPAERLLLRFERNPYRFVRRQMIVYASAVGMEYSEEFQELTRSFYL